jgi:hypothetical protein
MTVIFLYFTFEMCTKRYFLNAEKKFCMASLKPSYYIFAMRIDPHGIAVLIATDRPLFNPINTVVRYGGNPFGGYEARMLGNFIVHFQHDAPKVYNGTNEWIKQLPPNSSFPKVKGCVWITMADGLPMCSSIDEKIYGPDGLLCKIEENMSMTRVKLYDFSNISSLFSVENAIAQRRQREAFVLVLRNDGSSCMIRDFSFHSALCAFTGYAYSSSRFLMFKLGNDLVLVADENSDDHTLNIERNQFIIRLGIKKRIYGDAYIISTSAFRGINEPSTAFDLILLRLNNDTSYGLPIVDSDNSLPVGDDDSPQ